MIAKRIVFLILTILISSCGIEESSELLMSPGEWIGSALNRDNIKVVFEIPKDKLAIYQTNSAFRGFDIYYKLYIDNNSVYTNLTNDVSTLNTTGNSYTTLESLGYKRFQTIENGTTPNPNLDLFGIDTEIHRVTLNFDPVVTDAVNAADVFSDAILPILTLEKVSSTTGAVTFIKSTPLFRSSKDISAQKNLRFGALYDTTISKDTDTDLNSVRPIDDLKTYEIVLFLVAYGWSFQDTPRSEPYPIGIVKNIKIKNKI